MNEAVDYAGADEVCQRGLTASRLPATTPPEVGTLPLDLRMKTFAASVSACHVQYQDADLACQQRSLTLFAVAHARAARSRHRLAQRLQKTIVFGTDHQLDDVAREAEPARFCVSRSWQS